VALRAQVINFVGCRTFQQAVEIRGIRQVAVVQEEPLVMNLRIIEQMVNPPGVETARATDHAVDDIPFFKKLFSEVGTILSGNSCDESDFSHGEYQIRNRVNCA